jgi:hypothetical protein
MAYCGEDDPTLTHLLGYLTPKQWKDALNDSCLDKDMIKRLIKIQEDAYCYNLTRQMEEAKEGEN